MNKKYQIMFLTSTGIYSWSDVTEIAIKDENKKLVFSTLVGKKNPKKKAL